MQTRHRDVSSVNRIAKCVTPEQITTDVVRSDGAKPHEDPAMVWFSAVKENCNS